ncbi:MAG: cytochrome C [Planctomycetes bacterium]|nr:cytochrome C [Planctomycetota bacterium]
MWLSFRQAAINDERMENGMPPLEAVEKHERVLVWPDLVFIEFLSAIIFMVVLIIWSVGIGAPLEEPANPTKTPNPSKAPWYFLGLQEMLVYFDPWIAGVVLPSFIITGLMIIPYCDKNPKGAGYYTFKDRKFVISMFLFGFMVLWIMLIFMGTFLRGPNWNFFGPYEYWDVHKAPVLNNINLSEYFWIHLLGVGIPTNPLVSELPGIFLILAYFIITPGILMFIPVFKRLYSNMGFLRYSLIIFHFLVMMSLPIKMILRWTLNLKYIIAIPTFNI